jgi:hypothetical protein
MALPAYATPEPRALRKFGLVVGGVTVALFAALPVLRHKVAAPPLWPLVAGGLLGATALVAPRALAGFHRVWTLLGQALGWVNLRVILGVVFVVVVTPLGVLRRWLGADPLGRRRKGGSYRVESQALPRERMKLPF